MELMSAAWKIVAVFFGVLAMLSVLGFYIGKKRPESVCRIDVSHDLGDYKVGMHSGEWCLVRKKDGALMAANKDRNAVLVILRALHDDPEEPRQEKVTVH